MPTLVKSRKRMTKNINNQAYNMVKNIVENRNNFNHYKTTSGGTYLLMNNNNKKLLGFAFTHCNIPFDCRVQLIGTRPKKGYGKQIMNQIYKNARNLDVLEVRVPNAVPSAQPFYRALGYKLVPNYNRYFKKSVSPKSPESPGAWVRRMLSAGGPSPKRKKSPNRRN